MVKNKTKVGVAAKAHITILDERHTDFQKLIIANTGLDMSEEKRMIACSLNYTITINKIDIRTRGYDIIKNTKIFWIETYFIGKVLNTIIEDTKFERMVQGMPQTVRV